jgi:hypothetical protein
LEVTLTVQAESATNPTKLALSPLGNNTARSVIPEELDTILGGATIPAENLMGRKRKKLRGTVEKIIKPGFSGEPEKAQIDIQGADELYREIRVDNVLTDEKGEEAQLKPGAEVDIVVEADSSATIKKPEKT